jgi:twitching motility protein PilI
MVLTIPFFAIVDNLDYFSPPVQNRSEEFEEQSALLQGELHLRFFLPSEDEFALPAAIIYEVVQQKTLSITPIPNASPLLLGIINIRGQLIWVADLGCFLGYPHLLNLDRAEIPVIVIEEQEMILGLAVEKLGEIQWLKTEDLQLSNQIPDHLASYIQGEWVLPENKNKQYLRLLDHIAILSSWID